MKLFILDRKHQKINNQLDLGNLTDREQKLIEKITDFLEQNNITNHYNELKLAELVKVEYTEGEPELSFE